VQIREVRPHEHDAVGRLTVAAYGELPSDEASPAALLPGGHLETTYNAALRDVAGRADKAVVLVAVEDETVVGAVTYVPGPGPYAEFQEADAAGIRMLAVDPGMQRRGVGRALVHACIERAGNEGKRLIVLHTTPWMKAAQRLYEAFGFRRTPERDWSPSHDVELLGYVLELR
jgi:ribosomal protein S18 acetylase RimI-like enzyme